ncbi:hypothetical protein LXL04_033485 [Taraxacum kok-saghyz]
MIDNDSAQLPPFHIFFDCWLGELSTTLEQLVSAANHHKGDGHIDDDSELYSLIDKAVGHYEEYYKAKSDGAKGDVLSMFSPTWLSNLEDAFLWIAGWRPTIAIHLLYSKSGIQLEARLGDQIPLFNCGDLGDLTSSQIILLDELHKKTVREERVVTEKMAILQESAADTEMVELSNDVSEMIRKKKVDGWRESDRKVESVLERKKDELEKVLHMADGLRMATLKSIVEILTPLQAVYFLIAAAELQLRLHDWGQKTAGCRSATVFYVVSWESFNGGGAPDRYLSNKLRHIKNALKSWRRIECENQNREIIDLKKRVEKIELEPEIRLLSPNELEERRDWKRKILELENLNMMDIVQKARVKWLREGDDNNRFFHTSIKIKSRKRNIRGRMINGSWVTRREEIKNEAWKFFGDKFRELNSICPEFVNPNFKSLSPGDVDFLEAPFDIVEIGEAVWNCGGDKAPGLDGFTFNFIKRFWDLIYERIPRLHSEMTELASFSKVLSSISLSSADDRWCCNLSPDGLFYVHVLRQRLDKALTIPRPNPTTWLKTVPLKIIGFVWRACWGRIPSACALLKRGVRLENANCPFCILGLDDVDHTLISCDFVKEAMKSVFQVVEHPFTEFPFGVRFRELRSQLGELSQKEDDLALELLWPVVVHLES